jgi:hypothetical protein
MKAADLTDAEIRARGWQALIDRLGPDGALRFAIQTQAGHGDYARQRHANLGGLSVAELLARMRSAKTGRPRRRTKGKGRSR